MTEPRWLDGGGAALTVAPDVPTVWWFSLDDAATRGRADAIAPLPGEAATFAQRRDAGERALRRRLARLLLGVAGACPPGAVSIVRADGGAPMVIAPAGWHLSVAGRWPDAVIAIAPVAVGVDLERATHDAPPAEVLTLAERRSLDGVDAADRGAAFAACWAAKEAHGKWSRQPRALDPAMIETDQAAVVRSRLGTTDCWRRQRGPLVAAVCVAA